MYKKWSTVSRVVSNTKCFQAASVQPIPGIGIRKGPILIPVSVLVSVSVRMSEQYRYRYLYESLSSIGIGIGMRSSVGMVPIPIQLPGILFLKIPGIGIGMEV